MSSKIQFHHTDVGLHKLKDMALLVLSAVEKHHHPPSFEVAHVIGNNSSYGLSQDTLPAKAELKGSAESSQCGIV